MKLSLYLEEALHLAQKGKTTTCIPLPARLLTLYRVNLEMRRERWLQPRVAISVLSYRRVCARACVCVCMLQCNLGSHVPSLCFYFTEKKKKVSTYF